MSDKNAQKGNISDQVAESITRVEELAYELKIGDVMTRDVKTLTPEDSMNDVAELFRASRISGSPVIRDEKLVGVISIEDLIRSLRQGELLAPVEKYMTHSIISVRSTDPVVEALKTFVKARVGRLPVLSPDGKMVGILSKGDITRGLLNALQREHHQEELIRYRASHLFEDIVSDRTTLVLRYRIERGNFTRGGTASSHIKRALLRMGASPQIARRCGIAIYEAEMNLIIHSTNGGTIKVEIESHRISMEAYDNGPGIPDIEKALQPGYTTASEAVREMGFGAGMGLVNIKRCVDEMKLESSKENGTNLRMIINLTDQDALVQPDTYPAEGTINHEPE
jgi:CBS domain-containing protein/anti-sigma regulatory factor (Ser/Thr protein kinase)